jgi:hypothetical protein
MTISAVCPTCGQKGEVPDSLQGLRVKCPTCGQPFKVPLSPAAMPSPEPGSSSKLGLDQRKEPKTEPAQVEQAKGPDPDEPSSIVPPRPPLKYPALRAIAAVNEALGLFALVLGLAAMCIILFGTTTPSTGLFASAFCWTVLVPIGFFASAQMLRVFLDIEENTRYQNLLLSSLLNHVSRVQASRRPPE